MKLIINEKKVMTIPKDQRSERGFLCPCSLCEARKQYNDFVEQNIDALKKSIFEVIETIPDEKKELIVSLPQYATQTNILQFTKESVQASKVEKNIKNLILKHARFVNDFNKKYRFLYVCLLKEKIIDLINNIQLHKKEYFQLSSEAKLWIEYEVQLYLKSTTEVFKALKREDVIDEALATEHLDDIAAVRKTYNSKIRTTFNDSLSMPDFNPSTTVDTFRSYFQNV